MDAVFSKIECEIPRLRRYARALVRDMNAAEDLVQDCLTRALDKCHLWQPGTDMRAWLFTILHNQYVNTIRRAVREGSAVALSENEPRLVSPPRQGKSLEVRDMQRALAKLPEEQRVVVLMVALEGMRYEEVAALLDVPIGTVRSRLSRGREMLRQMLELSDDVRPKRPQPMLAARPEAAKRAGSPGREGIQARSGHANDYVIRRQA